MLVAAAVRRYPYSPFRVRPHNFPPWNSAVHKSVDARSASQAATKSVRPLQRTKLSEKRPHTRCRIGEIRYLLTIHQK
jgi:hypothetical protein